MFSGPGSQTGRLTRWGDYSGLAIDPADDCTFWYTNQYLPTNGSFNWKTRIGSFSMNNCTGSGSADFGISAAPPSQTISKGGTATYTITATPVSGNPGTVTLSLTGAPARSTVTFNPSSIPGGNGTSTLKVTTGRITASGTYHLTITGTSPSASHTTSVDLVVQ